jgi:hypothetical protein
LLQYNGLTFDLLHSTINPKNRKQEREEKEEEAEAAGAAAQEGEGDQKEIRLGGPQLEAK